jgi:hypothetical protein
VPKTRDISHLKDSSIRLGEGNLQAYISDLWAKYPKTHKNTKFSQSPNPKEILKKDNVKNLRFGRGMVDSGPTESKVISLF